MYAARRAAVALGMTLGLASGFAALAARADDAPPPQPAQAAAGALPDLDADQYFEGAEGGTFGKKVAKILPNSKRVAVGGFNVVFVTKSSVSASVRAMYLPGGVERTAAHSSLTIALDGVDNATFQKITDQAYANFMKQLAASGREVVPLEQIKPMFEKLEVAKTSPDKPYTKDVGGRTGVVFSPTGMPLWWWSAADAYGDLGAFGQHNMRTVPGFSKDLDAWIIAPMIVVDFAKMESSGNHSGLVAKEASVSTSLAVSVRVLTTSLVHAEDTKFGQMSKGNEAFMRMTKGVAVETPFAEIEEVQASKTDKFMSILSGASRSHKEEIAKTSNDRYAPVATQVLNQATGALAKFFQQHS